MQKSFMIEASFAMSKWENSSSFLTLPVRSNTERGESNMKNVKMSEMSSEQMTLFEELLEAISIGKEIDVSSKTLTKVIHKLNHALAKATKKEERERRRIEEMEAKRKAEEERLQQELHVRQVTSMELPLDWENVFSADPRTQDVHTDSISDAFIMSLTNLGRVDIEYISSIFG